VPAIRRYYPHLCTAKRRTAKINVDSRFLPSLVFQNYIGGLPHVTTKKWTNNATKMALFEGQGFISPGPRAAEAIPGSAPDPTGRGIATFLFGKGVPGLDLGTGAG
jgi:hypothetical protein